MRHLPAGLHVAALPDVSGHRTPNRRCSHRVPDAGSVARWWQHLPTPRITGGGTISGAGTAHLPGTGTADHTVHPQLEAQPRTPAPWAPRAPDPSCSRGTSPPRTSDLCVLPVGASPWRGPNAPGQPASQNSPPSCLPLGAEDGHQPRSGPWGTRAPLPRPGLPWGVSPSLPPPGRRGRFSASPAPRRQQVPPVTWKWPFSRAHPHGHLALGSPLHNEIQRSEHSSRFRTY